MQRDNPVERCRDTVYHFSAIHFSFLNAFVKTRRPRTADPSVELPKHSGAHSVLFL